MNLDLSEKELIRGCVKGKERYQKVLYDRFFSKMMSVCMRYSRDREEAQDILHEGYIKVFKNLRKYDFRGSFEGWIRRIMINTAINYYNRTNKLKLTHYNTEEEFENENQDLHVGDEIVLGGMNRDSLLKLIQTLPPAYRTVFNMYAIEGYSHKEIAKELGISEGTSKSNLARARMKLQKGVEKLSKVSKPSYA